METSEIIKEILTVNNFSQEKLATILSVSQKAVSNWLNGYDTPKASSMLMIYKNFGITPNELLGLEEPENFKLITK
jgi:transcriptional regulator with XRE-family HTH domain